MSPAEALDRVVYLLDRDLAESRRMPGLREGPRPRAGSWATTRSPRATPSGTLHDLPGIGPSTGKVIALALDGGIDEYLAELEAETAIPIGEGAALRAALQGDCHSHTTWSDGGAPIEEMARAAMALGHEYLVVTDHSPRLTIAHGLNRERLLAAARRDRPASTRSWRPFRILTGIEVDILEDGAPRPGRRPARAARRGRGQRPLEAVDARARR